MNFASASYTTMLKALRPFPFRNRRVQAGFPDSYRLGYERNGYVEARPGFGAAPIVFRFSLHPEADMPRPVDSGIKFVTFKAQTVGRPLERAGEARFFFEGQDESFRNDGVVIQHWQVGFRSWNIGVSATISTGATDDEAVKAALADLPQILGSLEEVQVRSWWSRLFGRPVGD